jgi:ankyrin repeat protein
MTADPDANLCPGQVPGTSIFFLGCFDTRVTVLSQQRRALNLVDAILTANVIRPRGRVAIVGGGASGVTAAAAFAVAAPDLQAIHLYERTAHLLHLQRGSDRHLHPHIYDWPLPGSTEFSAGLPILNWKAGTAGEFATQIMEEFKTINASSRNLSVFTNRFVNAIEPGDKAGCRLRVKDAPSEGGYYDAAIIAIGYGYERAIEGENKSYWTPSPLPGPLKPDPRPVLFVSGNGDGGLVDFTMAAFNRMTHTEIVKLIVNYEGLGGTEEKLLEIEERAWSRPARAVDIFEEYWNLDLPAHLLLDVHERLRLDADIWLHTREPQLFRRDTAILSRFSAFLAIAAARNVRHDSIKYRVNCDFVGSPLQGPVDIGESLFTPMQRFLRFGPLREENMQVFDALRKRYEDVFPPATSSEFKPATPDLTVSAAERFSCQPAAAVPAGSTISPNGVGAAVPSPIDPRQYLNERGIALGPESLELHLRSGNGEIVAALLKTGLPVDTLLSGHAPLDLALAQIERGAAADAVGAERFEVVKAIVAGRPRGLARAAHQVLEERAPARLAALLRAGVSIDTCDAAGQSLAARAMRLDGDGAGADPGWTLLLVKEGPLPQRDLAVWILLWAARTGRQLLVKQLLARDVAVDANLQNTLPTEDIHENEREYWRPGGNALHQAVAHAPVLLLLLEGRASVDAVDANGRTPLHLAAARNLLKVLPPLADRANLAFCDTEGKLALQLAAEHASEKAALILAGRRLPEETAQRADLLHAATYNRYADLLASLLEAGFDPNVPHKGCRTALFQLGYHWDSAPPLSRQFSNKCIDLLLAHGAEPSVADDYGQTVLHLLAARGEAKAVDRLIGAGAEVEALDQRGRSPLMFCNSAAVARRLISAGALTARRDSFGYTALDLALLRGSEEVCELLGGKGREPHAGARLLRAVNNRDEAEVKALISSGSSAHSIAADGQTALHVAAARQSPGIISLLLDCGEDINCRDLHRRTPLYACLTPSLPITGFDWDDHEKSIALLLDRGANPNSLDEHDNAAIFCGDFWWGFPAILSRLLSLCSAARSHLGETTLMVAIRKGKLDHVRTVLRGSADVNATDVNGRTALHLAVGGYHRDSDLVRLLLSFGADVEIQDSNGGTPLFTAVSARNDSIVDLLLEAGADYSRRNRVGETVLSVALAEGNAALVNRLRRLVPT